MNRVIFWNGKFLSGKEAPVLNLDSGLLRGIGLFETMRAYRGNIVYFNRHILRIKNSSKALGLTFSYSTAKIKKIIASLLESNALSDARVRITFWKEGRGSDILVAATPYTPPLLSEYRKGFALGIARLRQDEDSFCARHKTTSRLIYELNFNEARKRGFDEALMLNQRGYITESTRSNIFFAKKKTLFTPALDCGCLNGVTRGLILDLAAKYGMKFCEGKFTLDDLYAADEAFLTNSLLGLMPVACVEKKYFIKNLPTKISGFFMRKYRDLLKKKLSSDS